MVNTWNTLKYSYYVGSHDIASGQILAILFNTTYISEMTLYMSVLCVIKMKPHEK